LGNQLGGHLGGLLNQLNLGQLNNGRPKQAPFDFAQPRAALAEKGYELIHWKGPNAVPSAETLKAELRKASQLWVISSRMPLLTADHHQVIHDFFQSGRGLYIWGDNDPYNVEANALATKIFGTTMGGNLPGGQVVGPRRQAGPGFIQDHLLTTGIENLYEGITIATVQPREGLHPLLYGSANNLVAAFHDQGGKRAILDGGFTRLYCEWDTAGSGRYVKNAAAWLSNVEGRKHAADRAAQRAIPWYQRRGGIRPEASSIRPEASTVRPLGQSYVKSR
jgi:hypothetical protein